MVVAVIYEESHFNPKAVSKAGAIGLMQLMPKTAEWISKSLKEQKPDDSKMTNPKQNIKYGSWYLSFLKKRYGRDDLALAAYNGGFQNVDKWLSQSFAKGRSIDEIEITFGETREFVKRVQSTQKIYQRLYAEDLK
jgi:soluble lytic murein transglycosylase